MIPAWLVIAIVSILIGVGLNQLIKSDQRCFFRLRRPFDLNKDDGMFFGQAVTCFVISCLTMADDPVTVK